HRRRLSPARGAAVPVPVEGPGQGAFALQGPGDRLVPGGAEEHGGLDLRGAVPRMGARAGRRQGEAAALCRPSRLRGDRDRLDVQAPGAVEGVPGRVFRLKREITGGAVDAVADRVGSAWWKLGE